MYVPAWFIVLLLFPSLGAAALWVLVVVFGQAAKAIVERQERAEAFRAQVQEELPRMMEVRDKQFADQRPAVVVIALLVAASLVAALLDKAC